MGPIWVPSAPDGPYVGHMNLAVRDCMGAIVQSKALTYWGRVTHICVNKLTIIGSDNSLSPDRCQAIIWTNAGILLIRPLETNFSEIIIGIQTFKRKCTWKCRLRNGVHLSRPQCVKAPVLAELAPVPASPIMLEHLRRDSQLRL